MNDSRNESSVPLHSANSVPVFDGTVSTESVKKMAELIFLFLFIQRTADEVNL
jgi:hypothetical protein